ncbi:hypothetical protein [Azospirillum canadense]|uniref:hypothetical protein n=1 Tax=Azospirillum canadense TaxID=403962 RepID=UPI002225F60D|nr:hypothetical protein [Azospirillum canadense]MCW2242225.1 hypothetical protein [Azospirillum canadense]
MDIDDFGRAIHPEPKSFRDRVAFALCAHDIRGGEGRMSDEELKALERVLERIGQLYGSDKALGQFLGMTPHWAAQAILHLRGFVSLERGLRETEGKAIMHAHLIAADWPHYRQSADAAIGVMLERPEAVVQMVTDAAEADDR